MVQQRQRRVRSVTTRRPNGLATPLMFISSCAVLPACQTTGDHEPSAHSRGRIDLYRAICDGNARCETFDDTYADFFGAHVGLADCRDDQTAFVYGSRVGEESWSVTALRTFEWEAEVRFGGVFPSEGHVATNLGCSDVHFQFHSPFLAMQVDSDEFDWARPASGNVFIPLHGSATVDHEFAATARLDGRADAPEPRVTVTIDEPHAAASRYAGLGPGDGFQWGRRLATVVRVVAPEDGIVAVTGWVEICLATVGGSACSH